MDKKFLLIFSLILVLLIGGAFAVPTIIPTSIGNVQSGDTVNINFTLLDENTLDTNNFPSQLKLYYSTESGLYTNLIVSDTNLANGAIVICDDYNFSTTQNCYYTWTIPTLSVRSYSIDYNFILTSNDTFTSGVCVF